MPALHFLAIPVVPQKVVNTSITGGGLGGWEGGLLTGPSPGPDQRCQQQVDRKCPGFRPINGPFQQEHTRVCSAQVNTK